MDEYSIYVGTASTLYCRREKIVILIDVRFPHHFLSNLQATYFKVWSGSAIPFGAPKSLLILISSKFVKKGFQL